MIWRYSANNKGWGLFLSFFKSVTASFSKLSSASANIIPVGLLPSSADSVLTSYRAGEYQAALRQCEGLSKGQSYFHIKGQLLYKMGKLVESEKTLRQGLAETKQSDKHVSQLHEALGSTLADLDRLNEAVTSFEQALRCGPERSGRHRSMAEAWLSVGANPALALARAQVAARIAYSDANEDPDPEKMDLCEAVATLAWAVATNSQDVWEVEKLDRETSALCNPKNKPAAALVHYSIGRAYLELDKHQESMIHFEKAVCAEPQGNFGRLSKLVLLEIGV